MFDTKALGDYRIIENLGLGPLGRSYVAEDPKRDTKVLLTEVDFKGNLASMRESLRDSLMKGLRHASLLRHPAIVLIFDFGEVDGQMYLARELATGTPLSDLMEQQALDLKQRFDLACQLCSAVNYAHEEGILHGPFNPDNILVDEEGKIKIMDFGFTKVIGSTSTVKSDFRFSNPERIKNDLETSASDQFSLAALLCNLILDRCPFDGETPVQVMNRIVNAEIASDMFALQYPSLGKDLKHLFEKAMHEDPNYRFDTCLEIKQEFVRIAARHPLEHLSLNPTPAESEMAADANVASTSMMKTVGDSSDEEGDFEETNPGLIPETLSGVPAVKEEPTVDEDTDSTFDSEIEEPPKAERDNYVVPLMTEPPRQGNDDFVPESLASGTSEPDPEVAETVQAPVPSELRAPISEPEKEPEVGETVQAPVPPHLLAPTNEVETAEPEVAETVQAPVSPELSAPVDELKGDGQPEVGETVQAPLPPELQAPATEPAPEVAETVRATLPPELQAPAPEVAETVKTKVPESLQAPAPEVAETVIAQVPPELQAPVNEIPKQPEPQQATAKTDTPPPQKKVPTEKKGGIPILPIIAALVVAAVAIGVWFTMGSGAVKEPKVSDPVAVTPVVQDITFLSEPEGAAVFLDETFIGQTPVTHSFENKDGEPVIVTFNLAGFAPATFEIFPKGDIPKTFEATLEPGDANPKLQMLDPNFKPGVALITTEPCGAALFVDSVFVGTTPLEFNYREYQGELLAVIASFPGFNVNEMLFRVPYLPPEGLAHPVNPMLHADLIPGETDPLFLLLDPHYTEPVDVPNLNPKKKEAPTPASMLRAALANKSADEAMLKKLISYYPRSKQAGQAREMLSSLETDRKHLAALETEDIHQIEAFYNEYPNWRTRLADNLWPDTIAFRNQLQAAFNNDDIERAAQLLNQPKDIRPEVLEWGNIAFNELSAKHLSSADFDKLISSGDYLNLLKYQKTYGSKENVRNQKISQKIDQITAKWQADLNASYADRTEFKKQFFSGKRKLDFEFTLGKLPPVPVRAQVVVELPDGSTENVNAQLRKNQVKSELEELEMTAGEKVRYTLVLVDEYGQTYALPTAEKTAE